MLGVVVKAAQGAERPGHKYLHRKPDGKGGWVYTYAPDVHANQGAFDFDKPTKPGPSAGGTSPKDTFAEMERDHAAQEQRLRAMPVGTRMGVAGTSGQVPDRPSPHDRLGWWKRQDVGTTPFWHREADDRWEASGTFREIMPSVLRIEPPSESKSAAPRKYRYGARNRPPGYATVPKGMIDVEGHPHFRHGLAVYDRPLTADEQRDFELTAIPEPADVEAFVAQTSASLPYAQETVALWDEGEHAAVEDMLAPRMAESGWHLDRKATTAAIVEKLRVRKALTSGPIAATLDAVLWGT